MRGYRPEALDGLRGLAAQVVLAGHALGFVAPAGSPAVVVADWTSRLAVMAFFGLSGFAIATSLARLARSEGRRFLVPYAVHRAARILPPLVAAVAIAFAVAAAGRAGLPLVGLRVADPEIGLLAFLRGITLTFTTRDATFVLDGPLWSLRQEVWLYGLAALAALTALRRGAVRVLAAGAALAMVAATADRFFYLQSLALFGCGALAALVGADARLRTAARSPLAALSLVALAALPLVIHPLDATFTADMSNAPGFLLLQAALALPLALAILRLALGEGAAARVLGRCRGAAAFSYTLYVVHNPLLILAASLHAATGWLQGPVGAAVTMVVAIVAIETVAFGLARVVERPLAYRALIFRGLAALGFASEGAAAQRASATRSASPSR